MNIKHILCLFPLCIPLLESAVAEDKPTLQSGVYNLVTVEDPEDGKKPIISEPQLRTVDLTQDATHSVFTFTTYRSSNEKIHVDVKLELLNGCAFFSFVDPEGRFPRRVYAGGRRFSEGLSGCYYDLMQDGSISAHGRFLLQKTK